MNPDALNFACVVECGGVPPLCDAASRAFIIAIPLTTDIAIPPKRESELV
jgi:hypothetical protein